MFKLIKGSHVKLSYSNFMVNRFISQIKVMPPKPPKEFESKLGNIDAVYVIMMNVAVGASIWGVLQSDRGRDKFSSYFAEGEICRRLNTDLKSRLPEIASSVEKCSFDGVKVTLDPKLTTSVKNSEIICVSSISGSGFSTSLFSSLKDKPSVLWLDARNMSSTGSALINSLGGESPMLRTNAATNQFVSALHKYSSSSDNGLIIVVDHSGEFSDGIFHLYRELIADLSSAASKAGSKIRIILVNPTVDVIKSSLSIRVGKIAVSNFKGTDIDKLYDWGLDKLSKTLEKNLAIVKMNQLIDICGPDLRCISSFLPSTGSNAEIDESLIMKRMNKTLLAVCADVRNGLLSARDPKTQIAQLFVLEYLSTQPTVPFSPPNTILLEGLNEFVEAKIRKSLGATANIGIRSKTGELTLKQCIDKAIENLEKSGLLWRCSEDGAAVANESAPYICLKKRALVVAWNGMRNEKWVQEIRDAAIKAAKSK